MDDCGVEMIDVSSSNVAALGYDEANRILHVRFANQMVVIYKGVPMGQFEGLLKAPSIGAYMHRNIRNLYPYKRIE
ncbi:MAG: KTSC domain-containing protein [Deltaproteobacteria bacterium]|jgi:hypothetical protein|nr:KTSC domain-containing protein [Deltaproteobacteria bacterium]